jgi:hypothetical protein
MPTDNNAYHKPKSVKVENMPDAGYPQTDIGMDDVRVKGRFMSGTKQKKYENMRGAGAATKGKKFLVGMDI